MNAEFYDVKLKMKVTSEVIGKVVYEKGTRKNYAFKGKTDDGRMLTRFVKKSDWDMADVTVLDA